MSELVIIVTGVSRGIGQAVADELQRNGAYVVGAARDVSELRRTDTFLPVTADVSSDAGKKNLIAEALAKHGRIDGLVNNVGKAFRAPVMETTLEHFREMLEMNLLTAFELSQLAFPYLRESRGRIVNISSVTSHMALPDRIAYGTSKAALDHMTRAMAVEWGPYGISANAVLPWFTRTEMVEKVLMDKSFEAKLIATTPLQRLAEPEDIARAVAFLAMPVSDFISGQTLAVDGGYLSQGL